MAEDAAHLLIAAALALGLALLVLRGGRAAVRIVAAQGGAIGGAIGVTAGLGATGLGATGLGATGLGGTGSAISLGLAALALLAGNAAGWRLLAAPVRGRVRATPAVLGAALVVVLALALPREAVAGLPVRRDDLALALATELVGAMVVVRGAEWQRIGLLALANGTALVALALGGPPVALAATLLGLLVAGVAG